MNPERSRSWAALLFVVDGVVCFYGATVVDGLGEVLIALGGTFVFAGIISYTLSAERTLPTAVGESLYGSVDANERALVEEYGLSSDAVYIPQSGREPSATVVYRWSNDVPLPDESAGLGLYAIDGELTGISLYPSSSDLFDHFERTLVDEVSHLPEQLVMQLSEALTDGFELADDVVSTYDSTNGLLEFEMNGLALNREAGFDNPIQSFLAVGVACGLDCPVVARTDDVGDRDGAVVVCQLLTKEPTTEMETTLPTTPD